MALVHVLAGDSHKNNHRLQWFLYVHKLTNSGISSASGRNRTRWYHHTHPHRRLHPQDYPIHFRIWPRAATVAPVIITIRSTTITGTAHCPGRRRSLSLIIGSRKTVWTSLKHTYRYVVRSCYVLHKFLVLWLWKRKSQAKYIPVLKTGVIICPKLDVGSLIEMIYGLTLVVLCCMF